MYRKTIFNLKATITNFPTSTTPSIFKKISYNKNKKYIFIVIGGGKTNTQSTTKRTQITLLAQGYTNPLCPNTNINICFWPLWSVSAY
jgi:hypothetical protein